MTAKKHFGIISAVLAFACAPALIACGNGYYGGGTIVTYAATDSYVYSSTADVVKAVAGSVVEIRTESVTTQWGMQYVVSGAGSGVIVAHDEEFSAYYIVTNNHVIEGASDIQVTLRNNDKYDAELVATDKAGDIAVIRITEDQTLNVATWGNSDQLQIGEDLIAIGNPLGSLGGTVTKGILSATERQIPVGNYTMTLLQTDTAINPGNSGGGLFNMMGQLVGVVNAKTSDEEVEGICFAIPANTAKPIFDDLVERGVVTGRVTLGISVAAYSDSDLYITDAGASPTGTFEKYDKIVSINDINITSLLSYNDALATLRPDEAVQVVVCRGRLQASGFPAWGSSLQFDLTNPVTFAVTAKQLAAGAKQ